MSAIDAPCTDNLSARRRYHELLLAEFVAGSTVGAAARAAGVSRKTVQRWRGKHWPEVTVARREALDGLMARVRSALPTALERLDRVARESEDDAVAIRAALGIWDIFSRVSDRLELEERLSALEQRHDATR
ncbi:MAG: hypothetical protein ACKVPX_06070 [Myxococcaceae bacterium]